MILREIKPKKKKKEKKVLNKKLKKEYLCESGKKLIDAIWENNIYAVKDITKLKFNLNTKDHSGWTPIMSAACKGYIDILEVLINLGAGVNIKNSEGRTALMISCMFGRRDASDSLIKA